MNDKELAKKYFIHFGITVFCCARVYATWCFFVLVIPMLHKSMCMTLIVMLALLEMFCRVACTDYPLSSRSEDKVLSNLVSYSITSCFLTLMIVFPAAYYAYRILPN